MFVGDYLLVGYYFDDLKEKKKKKDMKWYICLVWLLISKNLQQNAINWNRNLCKVFIGVLSGKWSTTCKVSSEIDILFPINETELGKKLSP